MKTTSLILCFSLCFIVISLSAQFSIGLKGGVTRAWEDYGDVEVAENAVLHVNGVNLSGMVYYRLGKFLQVGIEPGFIQRGAACIPGFVGFDQDSKLFIQYAELPLMFAAGVPVFNEKIRLFGKAGFGLAYATSAEQETIDLSGIEPPTRTKLNLKGPDSRVNRWDNGFYGGLGFAWQLGRNQLFLEGSYFHGLRDAAAGLASENRNLNLGLGFMFNL